MLAELDIGKQNDNPTSLAVGQSVGGYTFVYAGVNSEKGKNEHFRMYAMGKKGKGGKASIEEASRARLFSSKDKATYQRVLRLSRPSPDGTQLGAAATGFGEPNELVIFDAVIGEKSRGTRGVLQLEKEAEDVDIIQTGPEEYLVAYCDNEDVYLKGISGSAQNTEDAISVYTMPGIDDGNGGTTRAGHSFRALRFLTPEFVAVLVNKPQRGGAYVRILRIMASTTGPTARVAQTLSLPKKVSQATGFAVSNLHPPTIPGTKQENTQFIFAIADGTNVSVASMDYKVHGGNAIVFQPRNLARVLNVHPLQITGMVFQSVSPALANARMPQILRLATVSVGNTVVVQSIPIWKKDEDGHYTVALKPTTNGGPSPRGVLSTLGLVLVAVMIQIILELADKSPKLFNARETMPSIVVRFFSEDPESKYNVEKRQHLMQKFGYTKDSIDKQHDEQHQASSGGVPTFQEFAEHPIASILDSLRSESMDGQHIVISPSSPGNTDGGEVVEVTEEHLVTFNAEDGEQAKEAIEKDIRYKRNKAAIEAHLHDEEAHGKVEGKTWEELGEEQKKAWIERLKEIGEWAGELPVTMFKGVIFSEIAGAVGRGVAGM